MTIVKLTVRYFNDKANQTACSPVSAVVPTVVPTVAPMSAVKVVEDPVGVKQAFVKVCEGKLEESQAALNKAKAEWQKEMEEEEDLERRAMETAGQRRSCAMKEDDAGEAMATKEYQQIKAALEEANTRTLQAKAKMQEASKLYTQLEGELQQASKEVEELQDALKGKRKESMRELFDANVEHHVFSILTSDTEMETSLVEPLAKKQKVEEASTSIPIY